MWRSSKHLALNCGNFFLSPLVSRRLCLPHVNQTRHVQDFKVLTLWFNCYIASCHSINFAQVANLLMQFCLLNFIQGFPPKMFHKKVVYGTDLFCAAHNQCCQIWCYYTSKMALESDCWDQKCTVSVKREGIHGPSVYNITCFAHASHFCAAARFPGLI